MKNKKRNFFIAVMIVVVVLYGVCVINVNQKYPETKEKILLLNQSILILNLFVLHTLFQIVMLLYFIRQMERYLKQETLSLI